MWFYQWSTEANFETCAREFKRNILATGTLFENHQVLGSDGLSQDFLCNWCGLYKRFVHNIMPGSRCIIIPKIRVVPPLGSVCAWNCVESVSKSKTISQPITPEIQQHFVQVSDFRAAAQFHPIRRGAAAPGHVQLRTSRELLTLRAQ